MWGGLGGEMWGVPVVVAWPLEVVDTALHSDCQHYCHPVNAKLFVKILNIKMGQLIASLG